MRKPTKKAIQNKKYKFKKRSVKARTEDTKIVSFTKGLRGNYEIDKTSYGIDASIA